MLLDQYGYPIKSSLQAMAEAQNTATGYRKIKDDGSERTYEDYDPVTGIKRHLYFKDGKLIGQQKWQNVDAILDMNHVKTEDYKPHARAKMKQQTAVPSIIFWDWMEKCGFQAGKNGGEYDKKKFDSLINDIEHRKFKTVPGRVSTQYREWY